MAPILPDDPILRKGPILTGGGPIRSP